MFQHIVRLTILTLFASTVAAGESMRDICARFAAFDQNQDGVVEIESLNPIHGAGEDSVRVLVLVEARLLEPLEGAPAIEPHVRRLVDDLTTEGFAADAITVRLGETDLHQDGRVILALRSFLRAVNEETPLAGVVLVGRFPDALIVRTCNWRKKGAVTLRKGADDERHWDHVPYLRRVPENVAMRGDIVIADLDGRWEDVYVQPRSRLETIYAVYPDGVPPTGGRCEDFERGAVIYEDFFHVSDGKLEIAEIVDDDGRTVGHSLSLFDRAGNHECGAVDAAQLNSMARPDIIVSRVDARGVAMRPKRDLVGVDGATLLDENGMPQAVEFESAEAVPHWRGGIWEADPILERRLLVEYFERNHAYRTGRSEIAWRPSSFACGLGSGYGVIQGAAPDWVESDAGRANPHGHPTLNEFVQWLDYPAVLRTFRAHSDPWGSALGKPDLAALEAVLGGAPWSWTPEGNRLVPSLSAACGGGKLDWFLLRSLWEYGQMASEPAFYHHTGCDGISPPGGANRPYDHPSYGVRQGGEAMLFFANGLALVGRSKVFYDEPRGFAAALRDGETFGEAWARYFEIEAQAESWGTVGGDIGRKRAYFWAVLGDWTLRLERSADPRPHSN